MAEPSASMDVPARTPGSPGGEPKPLAATARPRLRGVRAGLRALRRQGGPAQPRARPLPRRRAQVAPAPRGGGGDRRAPRARRVLAHQDRAQAAAQVRHRRHLHGRRRGDHPVDGAGAAPPPGAGRRPGLGAHHQGVRRLQQQGEGGRRARRDRHHPLRRRHRPERRPVHRRAGQRRPRPGRADPGQAEPRPRQGHVRRGPQLPGQPGGGAGHLRRRHRRSRLRQGQRRAEPRRGEDLARQPRLHPHLLPHRRRGHHPVHRPRPDGGGQLHGAGALRHRPGPPQDARPRRHRRGRRGQAEGGDERRGPRRRLPRGEVRRPGEPGPLQPQQRLGRDHLLGRDRRRQPGDQAAPRHDRDRRHPHRRGQGRHPGAQRRAPLQAGPARRQGRQEDRARAAARARRPQGPPLRRDERGARRREGGDARGRRRHHRRHQHGAEDGPRRRQAGRGRERRPEQEEGALRSGRGRPTGPARTGARAVPCPTSSCPWRTSARTTSPRRSPSTPCAASTSASTAASSWPSSGRAARARAR